MKKERLDREIVNRGLVTTRSQAESYIKLGYVSAGGKVITKPGFLVEEISSIKLNVKKQYVSRGALKLSSVAVVLRLNFKDKVVLDVGSSTGGFTDFALKHGAKKVIAVDIGTKQLHPSLRADTRVDLHEQTDIRNFVKGRTSHIDMAVIDVSFISLRDILPTVTKLVAKETQIIAMLKPQFESGNIAKHKGVIKNDHIRREVLKSFEQWVKQRFMIIDKADSSVSGARGNLERFYLLQKLSYDV